ncbi:MAG: type II 3-dehydroquinate dehydratase [Candidatus Izemoplasma sp.]
MNILVLNGPNINFIGIREKEVYGSAMYEDLVEYCKNFESEYSITIDVKQSNLEGILIDILQYSHTHFDGVILNAGAFTHYSYAIYDAIKAIQIPVVEVHMSDIYNREDFRKVSVIKDACIGTITGLGFESYKEGLKLLLKKVEK